MDLKNNLRSETTWEIIEKSFNAEQLVTTGSNFMIGNGYLGYRGTFEEWGAEEYTACVVTDTWDQAKGSKWSELCNVPNGLFTQLLVDGEMVSAFEGNTANYFRSLDLKHGLNRRSLQWSSKKGMTVELRTEKFASLDNHHLLVMQYEFKALTDGTYTLLTGIDGAVWSINGEHFSSQAPWQDEDQIGMTLETCEKGTQIVVAEQIRITGKEPTNSRYIDTDKKFLRELVFELERNEKVVIEKTVAITHSNEVENPLQIAKEELKQAGKESYEDLRQKNKTKWEAFWEVSDIQIEGNVEAQILARFNIYQAFIATPTYANLPIGARGLSCQVYQGAAFWDQETFNLPMFIYTHPEIARKLVTYRYDTLPGARRKAKRLGYYGAFYAWTSGKTGDELFPDFFFTDVLTGRPIRNHFNCWQIHISPDVVYGIWMYYQATADWEFMLKYGAEILFEVAQFLVSRVHFKKDKNRYEFIRLLGPDEYHENVDNNAFTNYLSRFALEKAVLVFDQLKLQAPERLAELMEVTQVSGISVQEWREIASLLFIPEPDQDTGVIEQFDGYFQLEDVSPDEVRKRLIDPDEYWGWPNGVAVHTQVLKQADVIQLLALLDDFPEEILQANYEYYEPRTEHGSSLSPSVHSLVASKASHPSEAYRYFEEAASIDLYNASKKVMSGGSFLGGIHTAAAGGVWLILVKGFGGFKITEQGAGFSPHLPEEWKSLAFKLNVRNCLLKVSIERDQIRVENDLKSPEEIEITLPSGIHILNPGQSMESGT